MSSLTKVPGIRLFGWMAATMAAVVLFPGSAEATMVCPRGDVTYGDIPTAGFTDAVDLLEVRLEETNDTSLDLFVTVADASYYTSPAAFASRVIIAVIFTTTAHNATSEPTQWLARADFDAEAGEEGEWVFNFGGEDSGYSVEGRLDSDKNMVSWTIPRELFGSLNRSDALLLDFALGSMSPPQVTDHCKEPTEALVLKHGPDGESTDDPRDDGPSSRDAPIPLLPLPAIVAVLAARRRW